MNYSSRHLDYDEQFKVQNLLDQSDSFYFSESNISASTIFNSIPDNKDSEDVFIIGIFNFEKELIGVIKIIRDYPELNNWFLDLILIIPELRNNGLGKKVYDDIEEWAVDLGAKSISLKISEQNKKGINFFEKLGFKDNNQIIKKDNLKSMIRFPVSNLF